MPTVLKKFLASLVLSILALQGFATSIFAQSPWYNQNFAEWHAKVTGGDQNEVFGERYTAAQVQWVIYGFASFILDNTAGPGMVNCFFSIDGDAAKACFENVLASTSTVEPLAKFPLQQREDKSLVELIFEERPISSFTYFKDIGERLNLVPEAQAQQAGFGFSALNPVLEMWKKTRDTTYFFFIIVIVAMAFMIMFRMKISPQAVITVQSSLPKIAVALILITFSYAIAGFLIDLMYVAIGVVALIFDSYAPPLSASLTLPNWGVLGSAAGGTLSAGVDVVNPAGLFGFLTKGQAVSGYIPLDVNVNLGIWTLMLVYFGVFLVTAVVVMVGVVGGIETALAIVGLVAASGSATLSGIGILILLGLILIVIIMMFLMIFRASIMLLKAYVMILILTIFAPLYILVGLLVPGGGFVSWMKSYITHLATFVVTGILFLLSIIFLMQAVSITWGNGLWAGVATAIFGNWVTGAFTTDNAWPPLLGSSTAFAGIGMLGASWAVFALIPRVDKMVEATIKGREFNYGSAIGEAFGPARWAGAQAQAGLTAYAGGYFYNPQQLATTRAGALLAGLLNRIPANLRQGLASAMGHRPQGGGGGGAPIP